MYPGTKKCVSSEEVPGTCIETDMTNEERQQHCTDKNGGELVAPAVIAWLRSRTA